MPQNGLVAVLPQNGLVAILPPNGQVAVNPPEMDWWPFWGKTDLRCTQAVHMQKDHCGYEATISSSRMSPGFCAAHAK